MAWESFLRVHQLLIGSKGFGRHAPQKEFDPVKSQAEQLGIALAHLPYLIGWNPVAFEKTALEHKISETIHVVGRHESHFSLGALGTFIAPGIFLHKTPDFGPSDGHLLINPCILIAGIRFNGKGLVLGRPEAKFGRTEIIDRFRTLLGSMIEKPLLYGEKTDRYGVYGDKRCNLQAAERYMAFREVRPCATTPH